MPCLGAGLDRCRSSYEFCLTEGAVTIEKYHGPGLMSNGSRSRVRLVPGLPRVTRRCVQRCAAEGPFRCQEAEAERSDRAQDCRQSPRVVLEEYDPLVPALLKAEGRRRALIRDFLAAGAFVGPSASDCNNTTSSSFTIASTRKYPFLTAMIYGYKAILSSTDFLFFTEPGGHPLTDKKDVPFDPSRRLRRGQSARLFSVVVVAGCGMLSKVAANKGELTKPDVLRAQVERMLKDAKAHRFTENFTGQWLDLRKMNDTIARSAGLCGIRSILCSGRCRAKTELFFEEILRHDRSVAEFVDSDWSILNGGSPSITALPVLGRANCAR